MIQELSGRTLRRYDVADMLMLAASVLVVVTILVAI